MLNRKKCVYGMMSKRDTVIVIRQNRVIFDCNALLYA